MGKRIAAAVTRFENAIGAVFVGLGALLLVASVLFWLISDWSRAFLVLWVLSPFALLWLGAGILMSWPASARAGRAGGVCLLASSAIFFSLLFANGGPPPLLQLMLAVAIGGVGVGALWLAARRRPGHRR